MSIEGKWETIRAEYEGEAAPELVIRQTELEFRAGRYMVKFAGKIVDEGTYEVGSDSLNRPLLILRGEEGPNAGKSIPSLIQQRGAILRVCYGLKGTVPQDFTTSKSAPSYLATYRRQ